MKIIFDVYPLLNNDYTGIPQTTWHIAKQFLKREVDCLYTIGYRILTEEEIKTLITKRSGRGWINDLVKKKGINSQKFLSKSDITQRIYLSPHVMSCLSGKFKASSRFIHDISSLTMPEYHPLETVQYDAETVINDIKLCDCIFTVSQSSKSEIQSYLSVPQNKIIVAYPGVEWYQDQVELASKRLVDQPYALILGTREPRKNRNLIYEYIIKNEAKILEDNKVFVFAGPDGWGESENDEIRNKIKKLTEIGKIAFTGFVPEALKLSLISNAEFLIFPSIFEGFGSPVAEALSLGTPVVCSYGGSLPEVGGDVAFYFNPFKVDSLSSAIERMELEIQIDRAALRSRSASQGAKFTWDNFVEIILNTLRSLNIKG